MIGGHVGKLTRHHLVPRCHRKPGYRPRLPNPESIIYLTREKHDAWHLLFQEASIHQVIQILKRIERAKSGQKHHP